MFRGAAALEEESQPAAASEDGWTRQAADSGSRLDDNLAVDASLSWPLHVRQRGDEAAAQLSRDATTEQAEGVSFFFHAHVHGRVTALKGLVPDPVLTTVPLF